MRSFSVNCGLGSFCYELFNEKFCCLLWTDKFLLRIVEWEIFVTNCGMKLSAVNCGIRRFCCKFWNEKFLADCGMKRFWCKLWNEKVLLQSVEWGVSCYELFNPISTRLFGRCSTGVGGCFPLPSITPLSLKWNYANFVQNYFGIKWTFSDKEKTD